MDDIRRRVDEAATIWESGYGRLVSDLNMVSSELFPESPALLLEAVASPPQRGMQYHRDRLKELLGAELSHDIPTSVQIVTSGATSLLEDSRTIAMRDGTMIFPWCIGLVALGESGLNLDKESLAIRNQFRRRPPTAEWFDSNVLKPTTSHAASWRTLFQSWRKRYKIADLPWDKWTEARNKWIYEECLKGTTYNTIIIRMKKKPKAWDRLGSVNGIKRASKRYAEVHNLDEPPTRQPGRPPGKSRR